jgi:hypothetical protein
MAFGFGHQCRASEINANFSITPAIVEAMRDLFDLGIPIVGRRTFLRHPILRMQKTRLAAIALALKLGS